jgi:Flp pilus assembly pilin Flp
MALYRWIDRIRSRSAQEKGQTMAEYAVVLGVITPVIVVAFALLAEQIAGIFNAFRGYFS